MDSSFNKYIQLLYKNCLTKKEGECSIALGKKGNTHIHHF